MIDKSYPTVAFLFMGGRIFITFSIKSAACCNRNITFVRYMKDTTHITADIIEVALKIGFSACGVTDTRPLDREAPYVVDWLQRGYNGNYEIGRASCRERV